jgi:hypothetical protein
VISLLVAAVIAAPGASSYCSPSGDLCYGIVRRGDAVVLRIDTIERYFARYTLCVRSPRGRRVCGSFPIFRNDRVWTSAVRWRRQFPNDGPGRYAVTWRLGGGALGPALSFRR